MNYAKLWTAIAVPLIVFAIGYFGFDATPEWTAQLAAVGTAILVWLIPNTAPAPTP